MKINIYRIVSLPIFLFFTLFYLWQSLDNKVLASGTSYDGELKISPIRDSCSTERPIATYSFRNGETTGILYATSCRDGNHLPSPLVDYVKYKFIDTGGSNPERCYGIVDTSTPSGIRYSWEFLGAVPGYSCSNKTTIHKIFPKGY
ncbi:MAG: hypothetical protein AAFQ91_21745 [Cyanobacteria bacterium J06621_15]